MIGLFIQISGRFGVFSADAKLSVDYYYMPMGNKNWLLFTRIYFKLCLKKVLRWSDKQKVWLFGVTQPRLRAVVFTGPSGSHDQQRA
jgi:hypothetical protein